MIPASIAPLSKLKTKPPIGSPVIHVRDHQRGTFQGMDDHGNVVVCWDTTRVTDETPSSIAFDLSRPDSSRVDGGDVAAKMIAADCPHMTSARAINYYIVGSVGNYKLRLVDIYGKYVVLELPPFDANGEDADRLALMHILLDRLGNP